MDDKLQHIINLFDICLDSEEEFLDSIEDSTLKAKSYATIKMLQMLKQSIIREYGK